MPVLHSSFLSYDVNYSLYSHFIDVTMNRTYKIHGPHETERAILNKNFNDLNLCSRISKIGIPFHGMSALNVKSEFLLIRHPQNTTNIGDLSGDRFLILPEETREVHE